jgi:hypothetical protein
MRVVYGYARWLFRVQLHSCSLCKAGTAKILAAEAGKAHKCSSSVVVPAVLPLLLLLLLRKAGVALVKSFMS